MHKVTPAERLEATKSLEKATREWRSAKKKERASRDKLAQVVQSSVAAGILSESKISQLTEIPRMTIRKMLGKDVSKSSDKES